MMSCNDPPKIASALAHYHLHEYLHQKDWPCRSPNSPRPRCGQVRELYDSMIRCAKSAKCGQNVCLCNNQCMFCKDKLEASRKQVVNKESIKQTGWIWLSLGFWIWQKLWLQKKYKELWSVWQSLCTILPEESTQHQAFTAIQAFEIRELQIMWEWMFGWPPDVREYPMLSRQKSDWIWLIRRKHATWGFVYNSGVSSAWFALWICIMNLQSEEKRKDRKWLRGW